MLNFPTEWLLILLGSVVVLSYLFSIVSNYTKIPSVLLLLFAGLIVRQIAKSYGWQLPIHRSTTEFFGSVGLIMIVLEAGLDLKLGKDKIKLITSSFFAAFFIFILSVTAISTVFYYVLHEPVRNCIVYAIPLSIMSSSIVIPSLHSFIGRKKEFLVYEASFSDIIGIILFDYFTAQDIFTVHAVGSFFLNIFIGIILSVVFSVILFIILTKTQLNVKFFLVFALLVMLYEGGKLLDLPSMLIILVFGLLMNNWLLLKLPKITTMFPKEKVDEAMRLLHSITAETSFLIRTFFFLLFGYSIRLSAIGSESIIIIGSIIVIILFSTRYMYLRFFLKESVYPETFFIPRGLITILLFYKIPEVYHPEKLQGGILFYVVLVTSIIMMLGMIFYHKKEKDIVEEELMNN